MLSLISLNKIQYQKDGKDIFKNITFSIKKGEKIFLLGDNGSGKSTIMKIISGIEKDFSGEISVNCRVFYLPQLIKFEKNINIIDYISKFTSDWWKVFEIYKNLFKKELNSDTFLSSLSGGELIKLHLSIGISKEPDVFLLDEPTNHLDTYSIDVLLNFLKESKKTFLITSHDKYFIRELADKIFEISNGELITFSGSYDEYINYKKQVDQAREDDQKAMKKEFRKAKKAMQKEQIRYQKSQSKIKRQIKLNISKYPPIVLKGKKRQVQTLHGVLKKQLEKSKEEKESKMKKLEKINLKNPFFDIVSSEIKENKLFFSIKKGELFVKENILIKKINLDIYAKDRISLMGDNGSGKSSFVKGLIHIDNKINLTGLEYEKSELNSIYIDQKYEIINSDISVSENVRIFNKNILDQEMRRILGNMLFSEDLDIYKKAKYLSGGETARLAFCLAVIGKPDILILDEPTNNLDLRTLEALANALKYYQGALIVISHNRGFLEEIGIERYIRIEKGKIKEQ